MEELKDTYGRVNIEAKGLQVTLVCNAFAYDPLGETNEIQMLSVAGANAQIKAVAACLHRKAAFSMISETCKGFGPHIKIREASHSFDVNVSVLNAEFNIAQLLAVVRRPGILPDTSANSTWQALSKLEFTTPRLDSWKSWIVEEMRKRNKIRLLRNFNASVGLLEAKNDDLDEIVSDGVKTGALMFKE